MLRGDTRQWVIDKLKTPLMKAIITLCKRYPEPNKGNTTAQNTDILIDIRDKFFKLSTNQTRKELYEAAWRMFIVEFESEPEYRYIFYWIIEEIVKSDWKPRPVGRPVPDLWAEQYPYGGIPLKELMKK